MRKPWKSVLGLALLAPLVGEFLLGNVTIRQIGALIVLAPLYGGGALLIREATRRTGKGWPTILGLGLAYGLVEAGVFDGSLFSTSYEGMDYDAARIPVLGVSAFYGLQFVINHAVWSIGIPILLVETMTPPHRRMTPWLGRVGLGLTAVLYLSAGVLIRSDSVSAGENHATWAQMIGVVLVALAVIAIAVALPGPSPRHSTHEQPHSRSPRPLADGESDVHSPGQPARWGKSEAGPGRGWAPRPWLVGLLAFVLSSTYIALPASWLGVALTVAIAVIAAWLGPRARNRVALAAGALLTYAWAGFLITGLKHDSDPVAFAGNAAFAMGVVVLVAVAIRGRRTVTGATQEVESSRKA